MSNAGGHRDRGFAKWWIWLAVVFAVAIGLIYLVPFVFSSQPEQELGTAPASVTEANQTDNDSAQQPEQTGQQQTKNVSIAEDSPSRGAEEAVPRPQ